MDLGRGADVELFVVGGLELRWRGKPVELDRPSQRLLAFLAIQDRAMPRWQIAGSLWPDTSDAKAAASLRTALWRIRRTGLDVVTATSASVRLSESVWVDLRSLEDLVHQVLHDPASTEVTAFDAHLLTDELLPGFGDPWVVLERERIRQVGLHALEALCRRWIETGHHTEAVLAGTVAVEAEPLRESSSIVLIEAHLAEGNRSEAVRQYERYRAVLRDELGLEPSVELRDLVGRHASGVGASAGLLR